MVFSSHTHRTLSRSALVLSSAFKWLKNHWVSNYAMYICEYTTGNSTFMSIYKAPINKEYIEGRPIKEGDQEGGRKERGSSGD